MRKQEREAMRDSDLANTVRLSEEIRKNAAAANEPGRSMSEFVKAHMRHCAVEPTEETK